MKHDASVDRVVARAQREVAARREVAAQTAWSGPWQKLLPVIVLAVVAAFLSAPRALSSKLLLAMGGVCGLRPSHSYFAGGVQLPLEARMVGIFAGFALTLIPLFALGRVGTRRLGNPATFVLLALFFASMVFDGVNSTLYEFGQPHLYAPSNPLRLLTGLLSGIAAAPFLVWFLSTVSFSSTHRDTRRVVATIWEPFAMLVPAGLFAVLVISETGAAYAPAAILSVGGIVVVMAMAVLALLVFNSPLRERVTRWQQLAAPGALAVLISFAILAVSAYLRWSDAG